MVVDEYGQVSGMITLENVIEEVVGPIQDEFDSEAPPIVRKGEHSFEVDARCLVDEVIKKCEVEMPSDPDVDTIGGFVVSLLDHIPVAGEEIEVGRHKISVLKADAKSIQRVLITELRPQDKS